MYALRLARQGAQDTAIAGYDDYVPLLLGGVQVTAGRSTRPI